ncbi:MAG: PKD domain-containing protein, partial [Fibrobacteres bacterium]|nr:PKD domain-containing protein [Fibrobacterota bacterium]
DSVPPFFCYNPLDFGPNKARKQAVVVRTNYTHKNSSGQDDSTSSDKRFIDGRTNLQNAVGDDGVTIQELIQVSRYGNPGTGAYRTTCGLETRCAMLAHTVNKGEDPRIAMMWVALGNPDYTPFIPVWVENGIKGDLLNVQTTYITDSLHHFIDFATILYNNRDSSDYDKYVNQRFEPLEENFINAVTEARKRWFESGFVYSEAKSIYTHSAATGWQTLKTISLQSKINKRSLNSTPTITNIQAQIQGNSVLFSHNGNDPDGNITNTLWDFGDGNVSNNANPTHNYTSSGTYLVMCKITDNNGSCNARWKYITVSPTLTEKHSNNDVFKNIQISPNPFNPGTSIQIVGGYSKNDVIKVSIFNNCGQLMDTFKSTYSGSTCVINWDASNRPGGLYFFKVDNGKQIKTAKAMLLN